MARREVWRQLRQRQTVQERRIMVLERVVASLAEDKLDELQKQKFKRELEKLSQTD